MEIVHEMKVEITIIDKNAESGELPLKAADKNEIEKKLKEAIGADDIHVTELKSFEIGEN